MMTPSLGTLSWTLTGPGAGSAAAAMLTVEPTRPRPVLAATRFDVLTARVYHWPAPSPYVGNGIDRGGSMEPTLMTALKAASAVKHGLDHAALRDQMDAIERRLDAVGAHLAEDVVSRLRAGFAHLGAAQGVSSPALKAAEFAAARGTFAEFSERRGGDELLMEFQQMTGRHISALGHLGNYYYYYYYYFLLNDEEYLAGPRPPCPARKELFEEGISTARMSLDPRHPGVEDLIDACCRRGGTRKEMP